MIEVCVDTREQKDMFLFKSYADVKIIDKKVDIGDYTVLGKEKVITIDRKRTPAELYINFGVDSARFNRELENMQSIDFCYFVCTFPYSRLEEFPNNSGIPKYKWSGLKMSAGYLRKRVKEIEEKYPNIKFIFCNTQEDAEEVAYQILKEYSNVEKV